jgi:transcriptional regulator with XRE-family HTH domain
MTYNKRIKQLQEELQMPQRRLAAVLEIDTAILSRIKREQRKVSCEQMNNLAAYFDVSKDDLIIAWPPYEVTRKAKCNENVEWLPREK